MNHTSQTSFEMHKHASAQRVVGVFAKHWTPGKVKTRLATTIGHERAARFHLAALTTTVARLSNLGALHILAVTPREMLVEFKLKMVPQWQIEPQCEGNLGTRMHHFFATHIASAPEGVVLLGSDSPDLPLALVEQAFHRLRHVRLVLGPSTDGGYYLIGARGEVPPVFNDMPFGAPSLFDTTLATLADLGWKPGTDFDTLAPWYDVDEYDDLVRLHRNLNESFTLETPLLSLRNSLVELGIDAETC